MKFSLTGILLGLICLAIAIKINYDMSIEYHNATGKTRALFGLTHLDRLYYGAIGLIGILCNAIAIKKKERIWIIVTSILISIVSIKLTYTDLWKWMI